MIGKMDMLDKMPQHDEPSLPESGGVWHSISSAPLDGTHILGKSAAKGYMNGNQQTPPYVMHWFDCGIGAAWVLSSGDAGKVLDPAWWQTLPQAPNAMCTPHGASTELYDKEKT